MSRQPAKQRRPYKKLLSLFEMDALAQQHADSPIFHTNRQGDTVLEPWLKELRWGQAYQLAAQILGREIAEAEFRAAWNRTPEPRAKNAPSRTPNTATFGGYRHRTPRRYVGVSDRSRRSLKKKKR